MLMYLKGILAAIFYFHNPDLDRWKPLLLMHLNMHVRVTVSEISIHDKIQSINPTYACEWNNQIKLVKKEIMVKLSQNDL